MARGFPLSDLAYESARGRDDEVLRLLSQVDFGPRDEGLVFCNEFGLELLLAAQRVAGRMSRAEIRQWRRWRADHHGRLINPVARVDDALPIAADVASQLLECMRHPRAFWRNVVLDRAAGRPNGRGSSCDRTSLEAASNLSQFATHARVVGLPFGARASAFALATDGVVGHLRRVRARTDTSRVGASCRVSAGSSVDCYGSWFYRTGVALSRRSSPTSKCMQNATFGGEGYPL